MYIPVTIIVIVMICIDPYSWSEDVASVALSLFQKGVVMNEPSVTKLVATLQRNAVALCKSSKFAKLVIQLCKSPQYQPLVGLSSFSV